MKVQKNIKKESLIFAMRRMLLNGERYETKNFSTGENSREDLKNDD